MMWKNLVKNNWWKLIILAILIFAALLRLHGVNWDDNQHLHPDERFLTLVAGSLDWPSSLPAFFETNSSSLNPQNRGYNFYVYGTYPVWVVKYLAEKFNLGDYNNLTLVGRQVSSILDLGVMVLVFAIAIALFADITTALLSSFLYATFVLPIQLSHYFAVDPFATFFSTLAIYASLLLLKKKGLFTQLALAILLGVSVGLMTAAKVSSLLVGPLLGAYFLLLFFKNKFIKVLLLGLMCGVIAYCTLRVAMPYLFANNQFLTVNLNPKVLANWKELKSYDNPEGYFPPATMWLHAPNYLFPLQNLVFQGIGIIPSLLVLLGSALILLRKRRHLVVLLLAWVLVYFAYQGGQFTKPMRYFYALYPALAVVAGVGWMALQRKWKWSSLLIGSLVLIWPLAFEHIYSVPHSRVAASAWIYANIPAGTSLSCETWDDCLPLNLQGYPGNGVYKGIAFQMFDPDTSTKWSMISDRLTQSDYVILSSSRVYGSTVAAPEKFPGNVQFYKLLFSGQLGFTKVAEFVSRPTLPFGQGCLRMPGTYGYLSASSCEGNGLQFVDDYTDETYTVYDHPKVTIFKKIYPVDYLALLGQKISPPTH